MKKHLNTLFITSQGTYLHKEGETIVVKTQDDKKNYFLVHTIESIVCFGNIMASPYLLGFCSERQVSISFLSEYGRFLARVTGSVSGNVLLRRQQYRLADDMNASANIAKNIVAGKICNCRNVLQRFLRDHTSNENIEIQTASLHLKALAEKVFRHDNLDVVRGIEGDGAKTYFSVFDRLILAQKEDFVFKNRNRYPPLDNVNCLLSFFYMLLMHEVRSALECVGLDPAVGYLHRDRPGRFGLALDLMEEFRSVLTDRLVLNLINLKQVEKKGFKKTENGAVLMNDETRKKVLVAWQTRKQDEIMHPYIEEKVTVGKLFYIQALLFARFIRGDIDGYPPFIWK